MTPKKKPHIPGISPGPNIGEGVGLQDPAGNDVSTPSSNSTSEVISRAEKTNIATKEICLDAICRLKQKLVDTQDERDEAAELRDLLAGGLITARELIQAKEDELKRKKGELSNWMGLAERLGSSIQMERRQTEEARIKLARQDMLVACTAASEEMYKAENKRLGYQIAELKKNIQENEKMLVEKDSLATESESQWRSLFQDLHQEWRLKLKKSEDQVAALKLELQTAGISSQWPTDEMDIDT